ncbi:hypothetical protein NpPPO83_00004378 [Neofusicoccum parvum]|uniref:Uncharacterized protein n=1 Tax=Neofusicoccum parvum TaxID=310453 RepID=A0ACB5SCX0_9PEZI|nr:hypothetical protein NpPPO83_00004378 [Neofusicoccum parvum]
MTSNTANPPTLGQSQYMLPPIQQVQVGGVTQYMVAPYDAGGAGGAAAPAAVSLPAANPQAVANHPGTIIIDLGSASSTSTSNTNTTTTTNSSSSSKRRRSEEDETDANNAATPPPRSRRRTTTKSPSLPDYESPPPVLAAAPATTTTTIKSPSLPDYESPPPVLVAVAAPASRLSPPPASPLTPQLPPLRGPSPRPFPLRVGATAVPPPSLVGARRRGGVPAPLSDPDALFPLEEETDEEQEEGVAAGPFGAATRAREEEWERLRDGERDGEEEGEDHGEGRREGEEGEEGFMRRRWVGWPGRWVEREKRRLEGRVGELFWEVAQARGGGLGVARAEVWEWFGGVMDRLPWTAGEELGEEVKEE